MAVMRFCVLAIILCFLSGRAQAALFVPGKQDVHAGNKEFSAGHYKEALDHYAKAELKAPASAQVAYNTGTAYYKDGDFDRSAEFFEKALLTDDDKFKGNVYYNLGNALYRSGLAREKKDIETAISRLEKSLGSFDHALASNQKDSQAAANRGFVSKELERLKEEKKQQQQKDSTDKNKDQSKPQKDDQKNDQGSDQKQEQSGSSKNDKDQGKDQAKDQNKGQSQEQAKDQSQDQVAQKDQKKQEKDRKKVQEEKKSDKPTDEKTGSSGAQTEEASDLTKEEADAMLDDFEQNDLPQGSLNFAHESQDTRNVEKDW